MKNLKVTLPQDVDELIKLGDAIIKKHMDDGPESNLSASKIAKINFTLAMAREKYQEVLRYQRMMDNAFNELKNLVGTEKQKDSSFKKELKSMVEDMVTTEETTENPVFKYVLIENDRDQPK